MTSFWKMTLMLPWQTVQAFIFSDSQTTVTKFWANSLWFLVIHKPLWKHFWGDSQWFTVIYKSFWNCFRVILSDSWWFVSHSENILGQFSWFLVILNEFQWFMNQYEIVFGVILNDCWWFASHSENILGQVLVILSNSLWFLMILGDSWISLKLFWCDSQQFSVICEPLWFMNHSENILGWFSVIHESVWNCSWVILCDLRISLKWFCKPFLNDAWIIKNRIESSQIIHHKKEEELIF